PFSDLLVGLVSGPAYEDRPEPAALSRPAPLGARLALRVFGDQALRPAPRKHREAALAQRPAPTLPAAMQHAVAHGVEQNRLHTVPPDGGGDLHGAIRSVCDAQRLRCLQFIIAIHRPQPTPARPAAYRCAVFVALTRHRPPSFRWGGRRG